MRRNVPTLRSTFALDAMGQRDRSLKIGRAAGPSGGPPPVPRGRPDLDSVAMIERLTAIELSFVQPIEKSGREVGGIIVRLAEPGQSFSSTPSPRTAAAVIPPQVTRSAGGVRIYQATSLRPERRACFDRAISREPSRRSDARSAKAGSAAGVGARCNSARSS